MSLRDLMTPEQVEAARLRYRRLGRHLRRTAPKPKRVRPSDIAPRHWTDGLKPNHAARALTSTIAPPASAKADVGANTAPSGSGADQSPLPPSDGG